MSIRYTTESFAAKVNKKTNGKFRLAGEYLGCKVPVTLVCNDCGTPKTILPQNIGRAKDGCDECIRISKIRPTIGVDDLWTVRPDVASLLQDPEHGYLYKENSKQHDIFKCPICGRPRSCAIYSVSVQGFSCPNCSDGISYPNKFMSSLLRQLGIDFIPEYDPIWIKPYRYDFFFNIDSKDIIVEMDGGLGHGHSNTGYKTRSPEEAVEIDNYKTSNAIKHGIQVIRIDCNYRYKDRFVYITNNIKSSNLSELIDLSKIDFVICNKDAEKSLFFEACKLWDSGIHNKYEISKLLGVSHDTVRNYLIKSEQLGYSSYIHDEYYKNAIINSRKKAAFTVSFPVMCIETKEIFRSISSVRTLTGISVQKAIKNSNYTAGMLSDGTKLHWKKLTEQEACDYKLANNFDSTVIKHTYLKQCI